MNRERIDKDMAFKVVRKVLHPLVKDLGARRLVQPYLRSYNDENKSIEIGLGVKRHSSSKRHRTTATFKAVNYRDGKLIEGFKSTVEIDRELAWSRRHDNRQVQNKETVLEKILTFDETFNKLRTKTSLSIVNNMSATAQGEIAGFGGSVSSSTTTSAHTEVETEKFSHHKEERVVENTVVIEYPLGEIWLIERPVVTLQTIQPVQQWGVWDSPIRLDLYDWSGNNGPLPGGEHWNILEFASLDEVASLIRGEMVLSYKWSENWKPSKAVWAGLRWLEDESNRHVGPVEWDRVRITKDTGSLDPSIVTPETA